MKRLISLFVSLLLFVNCGVFVISGSAANSYDNWEEAYKDFFINNGYKKYEIDGGGQFESWGEEEKNIQATLYDMDYDQIPEIIVSNGDMGSITYHFYIFSFVKSNVKYLGTLHSSVSYDKAKKYKGVFSYSGYFGECDYYEKVGNSLKVTPISNENRQNDNSLVIYSKELYDYYDYDNITAFNCISLEKIKELGWASFLAGCNISNIYCNDIAIMCSYLSEAANDKWSDNIKSKYAEYGFKNTKPGNYGTLPVGPFDIPAGSAAYTFGYLTLDKYGANVLLTITTRGTTSPAEAIGDVAKGDLQPFLSEKIYDNVYDYEETVWNALKDYVNNYPEIKKASNLSILVTGHSLGGAAANTIAARINNSLKNGSETWLNNACKESVYAYTFGAIKVFFEEGDNVTPNINNGYENIHNIYNYYDTYGPNGSESGYEVGSIYDKYGHTELFKKFYSEDNDKYANHSVANYRDALNNHLVICNGKDDEINTDNNSNFFNRLVTGITSFFNNVRDVTESVATNVAVAVVKVIETVTTAIVDFFSGLFGG